MLAALVVALAIATTASATLVHPFISAFGPDGTSATSFNQPDSMAVDQSSHDIYLLDTNFGNGRIYRFTSAPAPDAFSAGTDPGTNRLRPGAFTSPSASQIAIAPPGTPFGASGEIYVTAGQPVSGLDGMPLETGGVLKVYAPSGALLGSLDGSGNHNPDTGGYLCGAATDPAGNLYLSFVGIQSGRPGHIDKYVPSKNPVGNADFDSEITGLTEPCQLAAGANSLYVVESPNEASGQVRKYPLSLFPEHGGSSDASGKGTLVSIGGSLTPLSVALDPSSGEGVYIGRPEEVLQFDGEGNTLSSVSIGTNGSAHGVAVDASSGRLFVSAIDIQVAAERQVRIYGPGVEVNPPSAEIDPVTTFTYKSAHFTGTVNAGGSGEAQATTYRFKCTPSCPGLQGNRSVAADGADHEVSDDTTGLEPETTYQVTLIAENAAGKAEDMKSFETPAKPSAEPPLVTIDPVTTFSEDSAHLTGTVNPKGNGENQATSYRFEYSADGLVWKPLANQGPIEGEAAQPVSEELEGLEPNTSYQVRLRAENIGGVVFSEVPNPAFTTQAAPPLAEVTEATHVLAEFAQLNARVNPRNSETTYYFQWGKGDCESSPCASVPALQDANAGSGGEFVFANAQVTELQPGTTYHYRLVAESAGGETTTASTSFTTVAAPPASCPNEAIRTEQHAGYLPDCRAYEMVSPPDKNGGNVISGASRTRAAVSGNAVGFASLAAFGDAAGTGLTVDYIARRTGTPGTPGWSTHSITPLLEPGNLNSIFDRFFRVEALSSDLSKGVIRTPTPLTGEPATAQILNLYSREDMLSPGAGAYQQLTTCPTCQSPLIEPGQGFSPTLADATPDFGTFLFEIAQKLTPESPGIEGNPYLYESDHGVIRYVGMVPSGSDLECGAPPLDPCVPAPMSVAGIRASNSRNVAGNYTINTLSDDGSKAFFTVPFQSGAEPGSIGQLYMRLDHTKTVHLNASERTDCADHNPCSRAPEPEPGSPEVAGFATASADGSRVFFVSQEQLTDKHGAGLYMYDTTKPASDPHNLTLIADLTGDAKELPSVLPSFFIYSSGLMGTSDEGSYVYLASSRALLPDQTPFSPIDRGIYLWHEGTLSFIGLLEKTDLTMDGLAAEGRIGDLLTPGRPGGWSTLQRGVRVTPDGHSILFASDSGAGLTGYDQGKCGGGNSECTEFYLYNAQSGKLDCVSCDPSGAPATSNAGFSDLAAAGPSGASSYLNRPLTADGKRVFFDTADPLVEEDTNGARDVYEYDVATETVHLISSGTDHENSYFMDASPDGKNVFFTTAQPLVGWDYDGNYDLYDARVQGGLPEPQPTPAPCASPETCSGEAATVPPSSPSPGSAGFAGPGNPKPRTGCPKGKHAVKSRGKKTRCLATKHHKSHKRAAKAKRGGGR